MNLNNLKGLALTFLIILLTFPPLKADSGTPDPTPNATNPGTGLAPRYAVIDLGVNMIPTKITNSGYILTASGSSYPYSNYYVWYNGTMSPPFTPVTPGDGIVDKDIAENGVVVGTEYINLAPAPENTRPQLDTEGPQLATWYAPMSVATPILTQGPVAWDGDSYNEGIAIDAAGSVWTWTAKPPVGTADFLLYYPGDYTAVFPDGYQDGIELGNMYWDSNDNIDGTAIFPLMVNNQGDLLSDLYSYVVSHDPEILPSAIPLGTYMDSQSITFAPTSISNEISGNVYVAGWNFSGGASLWSSKDGTTQTLSAPNGGGLGGACVNAATTTVNGAVVPTIQAISSSLNGTKTTDYLWEMNPATGQMGSPTNLDDLLSASSGWSGTSAGWINDNGAIVGTATYTPTGPSDPIAAGSHGVLLLPCQFSLLNCNQSGTDGLNFDGTRPATISAISDDPKTAEAITGIGIDKLGPLMGSPYAGGNGYISSLIVAAKVSPTSATNITYSWNRKYQDRTWAINKSADGTQWIVTRLNTATGFPNNPIEDSSSPPGSGDTTSNRTIIPSPKNIIYWFDSPGEIFVGHNFDLGPGGGVRIGDYAYEETIYTYTLSITVGTKTTTTTFQFGQKILACRQAINGTTSQQWNPSYNITSTSNIPHCVITTQRVQNIVGGNGQNISIPQQANSN